MTDDPLISIGLEIAAIETAIMTLIAKVPLEGDSARGVYIRLRTARYALAAGRQISGMSDEAYNQWLRTESYVAPGARPK
jgi:hypothetical protein